jgi:hypothetical protein
MSAQIAFLTLYLGLVSGSRPVALTASPGVARIELRLDGQSAGTLDGPPWSGTIDFGPRLLPHRFEARGLGRDGGELARAEQWVNLPRPPAEVEILVEGEKDKPGRVRLVSASRTGEPPEKTRLTLDGKPLRLDGRGEATVPAAAVGPAHVLSARVRFRHGVEARRDVVLTEDWGSEVATELTAVAVHTEPPGQALAARDLQGLFTAGGQPLRVSAVEQEGAEVFVVRAKGVEQEALGKLPGSGIIIGGLFKRVLKLNKLAEYGHFPTEFRCNLVAATPAWHETAGFAATTFDISFDELPRGQLFMRYLLGSRSPSEETGAGGAGGTRLADATAIAGLEAYALQRPRAVVLILKGRADDDSTFQPAAVRAYLAALGVPLFVWSIDGEGLANRAWGPIDDVQGAGGLRVAYKRLIAELDRQQIVWLDGRHLPQEIALSSLAAARGLALVSTPGTPEAGELPGQDAPSPPSAPLLRTWLAARGAERLDGRHAGRGAQAPSAQSR